MLSLVDSQSHSSSTLLTVCCTTRCCQTSDPLRQNRRRRHRTRRQTNLRLGYAPKSSFRSSWRLFTGHRQGKYFLFLSCFYQKYFDFNKKMLFSLTLRKFCKGRQSVANLSDLRKKVDAAGWLVIRLPGKTPQIGLDLFVLQHKTVQQYSDTSKQRFLNSIVSK